MTPDLSVIVPTLHYHDITQVVAALRAQTAAGCHYEVIVSDSHQGEWQDPIRREIERCPGAPVIYVQRERDTLWRSRALNAGIQAASGAIIVFLAGDFTPSEHFIAAHYRFHREHPERHAVAIGPSEWVHAQSGSVVRWLEDSGRLFGTRFIVGTRFREGDAGGFFYVGNASLKREFLEQAGHFDEDFRYDAFDDFELGVRLLRAGMKSYFWPDAVASHAHEHALTLAERLTSLRRAGESAAVFERKYRGPHSWDFICRRGPLRLDAEAFVWRAVHALRRRSEDLERFYALRCDAAFARGWRDHEASST